MTQRDLETAGTTMCVKHVMAIGLAAFDRHIMQTAAALWYSEAMALLQLDNCLYGGAQPAGTMLSAA